MSALPFKKIAILFLPELSSLQMIITFYHNNNIIEYVVCMYFSPTLYIKILVHGLQLIYVYIYLYIDVIVVYNRFVDDNTRYIYVYIYLNF